MTSQVLSHHEQLMTVVEALVPQEGERLQETARDRLLQSRQGRVEGLQAGQIGEDLRLRAAEADVTEELIRLIQGGGIATTAGH